MPWRSGTRCEPRALPDKAASSRNWLSAGVWHRRPTRAGLRGASARVIARLMTTARYDLARIEAILVAAIEVNVPELIVARTAIGDFESIIRAKIAAKFDGWLEAAKTSLIGSFADGVRRPQRDGLTVVERAD